MGEREIAALLADRAIERVERDVVGAEREFRIARRHLETAEQISLTDPEAAFAVGYDANQSQYDGLLVEPEEVADLLLHARGVVGVIGKDLGL